MRTPSTDRDAAITSWPPARLCCRHSTGADAQDGAASGLPAIHPAATSNRTSVSAQVSQPCVPRHRAEKEKTLPLQHASNTYSSWFDLFTRTLL